MVLPKTQYTKVTVKPWFSFNRHPFACTMFVPGVYLLCVQLVCNEHFATCPDCLFRNVSFISIALAFHMRR